MKPFIIERVWDAGKPVAVAERGSTLALLVEGTLRRIADAASGLAASAMVACFTNLRARRLEIGTQPGCLPRQPGLNCVSGFGKGKAHL
jgi:hypothetical protein